MWNEEYDIVIIGSGFAGLAAAIEARKLCSSVVILEKMAVPGGNSTISGGLFAAAGSPLQAKENIDDSPELMLADMLAAGNNYNYRELARIVAERSTEALLWTMSELGVKYKPKLSHLGGHSVPRTYNTVNTSGAGIIRPMLVHLREMEAPIRLKSLLTDLITDEAGGVEGVEIREDYIFPNRESGSVKRIRARQAVILATGGFSQDKEFRAIQNPMLTEDIESTNHKGATAESLILALKAGATPVQLSMIQLGPWASRDEEGFGVGSMFSMLAGFPYGILIDLRTGKRFVNEQADRKLLVDAMLSSDRESIAIVDEMGVQHASTLNQCLKRGVVRKFDTIDDLAIANQAPLLPLKHTIDSYNSLIESGQDDHFGKPIPSDLLPIKHPPYYCIRLISKVHHCMGGIRINARAQVIRIEDNQPISRLYAAGEITGGIHGASRLGSNAIPECLIFGRIAGINAASEAPR
ncbi:MAG TPA: flavocytochrome c [Smithellaceae bacterium]|jgi:flavocytochrome c|nr:flavocytochrome c [Smithellaceae bacterium]